MYAVISRIISLTRRSRTSHFDYVHWWVQASAIQRSRTTRWCEGAADRADRNLWNRRGDQRSRCTLPYLQKKNIVSSIFIFCFHKCRLNLQNDAYFERYGSWWTHSRRRFPVKLGPYSVAGRSFYLTANPPPVRLFSDRPMRSNNLFHWIVDG